MSIQRTRVGLVLIAVAVSLQGCGSSTRNPSQDRRPAPIAVSRSGDTVDRGNARVITPKPTRNVLVMARRLGFVRATPRFRSFCGYVAQRTSWTIVCPPIIPRGSLYALSGAPDLTRHLDPAAAGMPAISSARRSYFRPGWIANFLSHSIAAAQAC